MNIFNCLDIQIMQIGDFGILVRHFIIVRITIVVLRLDRKW